MDYNYHYVGFPNFDVAFDGQPEPQQQVFMQPNLLTQFQIWEPCNVTYETVMQDITAVLKMIENSETSISQAMCALKQMTEDLMRNTQQLGEFGPHACLCIQLLIF